MLQTERFIVLRKIRYSDSDLVVHALSSQGQKCILFARSALKSKKRFGGGVLEPTHYIRAVFREPLGESSMASLQEASLLYDFKGLRQDYERLETALHLLKIVDRVSTEGGPDSSAVFDLLGRGLKTLEISQEPELLRFQFEVKFLGLQGVLPDEARLRPYLEASIKDQNEIAAMGSPGGDLRGLVAEALSHYLA